MPHGVWNFEAIPGNEIYKNAVIDAGVWIKEMIARNEEKIKHTLKNNSVNI